jgi:hypothetical protein
MNALLISQEYFDETLLECQELFEYSNQQAIQETKSELLSSGGSSSSTNNCFVSLDHLSLTHPQSPEGRNDRELQKKFVESLQEDHHLKIAYATRLLQDAVVRLDTTNCHQPSTSNTNHILMYWSLMLHKNLWNNMVHNNMTTADEPLQLPLALLLSFVVALFPDTPTSLVFHPLCQKLKLLLAPAWFLASNKNDVTTINKNDITSKFNWFCLLETARVECDNQTLLQLLQLARKLCNGCEDNKKAFVNAAIAFHNKHDDGSGLESLVKCISSPVSQNDNDCQDCTTTSPITQEVCRLIAILGRFQPLAEPTDSPMNESQPRGPMVSSAHANVKELHKVGAVPNLHRIAKQVLCRDNYSNSNGEDEDSHLLCDVLSALRVMAIDNDIVQNMIALGILDTIHNCLTVVVVSDSSSSTTKLSCLPLATATFGLIRNLCANDEVKTSICKSSLPSILHVMQNYLDNDDGRQSATMMSNDSSLSNHAANQAILQEHACGILGAMALRRPNNAKAIVGYGAAANDDNTSRGGHVLILRAMQAFPTRTTLQRQGCLALRNIASRLSECDKVRILEAGAEEIIQNIAGRHPASSEEAYAALRDLGCNPVMWDLDESGEAMTKSTTQMFGTVQSNFRAVYE